MSNPESPYSALKAAALEATRGPWEVSEYTARLGHEMFITIVCPDRWICHVLEDGKNAEEDARCISLAHPQAILELLERCERLEAVRDAAENLCIAVGCGWDLDGVWAVLAERLDALSPQVKHGE